MLSVFICSAVLFLAEGEAPASFGPLAEAVPSAELPYQVGQTELRRAAPMPEEALKDLILKPLAALVTRQGSGSLVSGRPGQRAKDATYSLVQRLKLREFTVLVLQQQISTGGERDSKSESWAWVLVFSPAGTLVDAADIAWVTASSGGERERIGEVGEAGQLVLGEEQIKYQEGGGTGGAAKRFQLQRSGNICPEAPAPSLTSLGTYREPKTGEEFTLFQECGKPAISRTAGTDQPQWLAIRSVAGKAYEVELPEGTARLTVAGDRLVCKGADGKERSLPLSKMTPLGNEVSKKAAGQKAAEAWLKLIDRGRYQEAWTGACAFLKGNAKQEKWVEGLQKIRAELGAVKTRTLRSAQWSLRASPSVPGESVTLIFKTSFANKEGAEEVVLTTYDEGSWRGWEYFVN